MICQKVFEKNLKYEKNYLLVGNPNVGKSTFYNKITWKYSSVANIDKVTTTSTYGKLRVDKNIIVTDLPGINSLNASAGYDEEVTLRYILEENYDAAMNILCATSLKRDLYLSLDLAEAGILNSLIINMADELVNSEIKEFNLVKVFKVPVSIISAKKNNGLTVALNQTINNKVKPKPLIIEYNHKIEAFLKECSSQVSKHQKLQTRFMLIQYLTNNKLIYKYFDDSNERKLIDNLIKKHQITNNDIISIRHVKQNMVEEIFSKSYVCKIDSKINQTIINKQKFFRVLDRFLFSPYTAIPFFILLIFGIYYLTFGSYAGGFIQEQLAGGFEQLTDIIKGSIINLPGNTEINTWWGEFVGSGLFGGIFTILSFIPWIIILTLITSLIEQIGMLSRMSIIFDKLFEKFGISGRGVVNLITGTGCNIPSILLARNASSKKERIVSVLIAPLVSCSARAVVFGFIANALVGSSWSWLLVIGITSFSIVITLFSGLVFSKILFRNTNTLFIGNVSKWRGVDWFVLIKKTFIEVFQFVKKTIIIVAIANFIIWFLSSVGPTKFYLDASEISQSFLYYISYPLQYILYPTGLGVDWRYPVSIVASFPAKEVASSTIDTLFGGSEGFTIAINSLRLPIATIASYIMYFTFFIPCMATVVVINKEIGKRYMWIHILFSLTLAYVGSIIVYILFGSFESVVKYDSIKSGISLGLLLITIVFGITATLIYKMRSYLQMKGRVELVRERKIFLSINWLIGIISVIFLITSNILLFV